VQAGGEVRDQEEERLDSVIEVVRADGETDTYEGGSGDWKISYKEAQSGIALRLVNKHDDQAETVYAPGQWVKVATFYVDADEDDAE
jgi:hypothetical protein